MNNQIWIMTSAFDQLTLEETIEKAKEIGAQGLDVCVFRRDGSRNDFVATHLDYESFSLDDARRLLQRFNEAGLQLSLGAFDNLIGGDAAQRVKNQNHLLRLIRMAHLLGGDANDVKVGTFVGYNHQLGNEENGFQKNLDEYERVFRPIINYAEDLGVTILYENCPMEGWRAPGYTGTFNNLTGVLAARKLMYEMIPSAAHGEIYDPSHDIWQHTDPVDVIMHTDIRRLHRVHIKGTRIRKNVFWGNLYPVQWVREDLAQRAGIPVPANEWDRHNYEATLPGFGGSDSVDWRAFINALHSRGFAGPLEIENEAALSKGTNNLAAILQGFKATVYNLAPLLWGLTEKGYQYDQKGTRELKMVAHKDIPVVTMEQLMV
jgi:sugar phosphate isomerase/epimerase